MWSRDIEWLSIVKLYCFENNKRLVNNLEKILHLYYKVVISLAFIERSRGLNVYIDIYYVPATRMSIYFECQNGNKKNKES